MARTPNSRTRVEIMETPVTPSGEDLESELRAELRSAREVLAAREAEEQGHSPMRIPEHAVAHPRVVQLSTPQLRDMIDRLERDIRDVETDRVTLEALAEDARGDD